MSSPTVPLRLVITQQERERLEELVRRTHTVDAILHESMHEACAILGVEQFDHHSDDQISEANRVYDAVIGLDTTIDELLAQLHIAVRTADT